MPWLMTCEDCKFRVISNKKLVAELEITLHCKNSHLDNPKSKYREMIFDFEEDFSIRVSERSDLLRVLTSWLSHEDYDMIKNITSFPAKIL